ncbi:MAG: hypothetical protein ACKOTZ_04980 [Chloroflexota bacterium]
MTHPVVARLRAAWARPRPDTWAATVTLLAGGVALLVAMGIHQASPLAAFHGWLIAAVVAIVGALLLPRGATTPAGAARAERATRLLLGTALGVSAAVAIAGLLARVAAGGSPTIPALGAGLALVALGGLADRPALGRLHVPVLLGIFVALGVAVIWTFRSPPIDVWVFQHDAPLRLLAGGNPWAMDFPNIYTDDRYYGAGVVVDGRLTFGYPYPPLSLLAVTPATALDGDPRWAHLVALAGAAACIAWSRPGPRARGAAGLLLAGPSIPFLLTYAWTEPLSAFLLEATVAAAIRAPRLLGLALGCLVVSKQYLVAIVPLALLLLRPGADRSAVLRLGGVAGVTALLLTVPFALWDLAPFLHAVVALQGIQPARADSLGLGPWLAQAAGGTAPGWIPFAVAGVVVLLCLWRAPRTPAGFAMATAAVLVVFFALAKQAFQNYYLVPFAAILVAVAAAAPPLRATAEAEVDAAAETDTPDAGAGGPDTRVPAL